MEKEKYLWILGSPKTTTTKIESLGVSTATSMDI